MRRSWIYSGVGSFLVTLILLLTIIFPVFDPRNSFTSAGSTTWGNTSTGTSSWTCEQTAAAAGGYRCTATGTIDKVVAYFKNTDASNTYTGDITCGIYQYVDYSIDFAGSQLALQTNASVSISASSYKWVTFTFSTPYTGASGTWYYFVFTGTTDATGTIQLVYSSSSGGYSFWLIDTLPLANPLTGEDADGLGMNFSAYAVSTTDTTLPSATMNFAGNHSDKGGPYYLPPGESTVLSGSNLNGYYTNSSYQAETWVYINTTVTDAGSVKSVKLHWYNATTNKWWNTSEASLTLGFVKKNTNYYEINTSVNITNITAGHKYSFDIWSYDVSSNCQKIWWNKTGLGGTATRRYVYLKNTPSALVYTPLYLYNVTVIGGYYADRLLKDFGTDGGVYDTSFYQKDVPGDDLRNPRCGSFVTTFLGGNNSINTFTLTNIYFHIWYTMNTTDAILAWASHRGSIVSPTLIQNYTVNNADSRSSLHISSTPEPDFYNHNYNLTTHLLSTTSTIITDNNMYEILTMFKDIDEHPSIISNRSITSFILLNVPSNATLNASYVDSDSDGMHDWDELYRNYTNPFLADTDNDGFEDPDEILSGTDPNNYSDPSPDVSAWYTIQTITGTLQNTTSFKTIQTITGTLQNITSFKTLQTITGTLQNTTSFKTLQTITGVLQNTTSFKTLQTISGVLQNTTSFKTIQTISGVLQNTTSFKTLQTISGVLQNTTSWRTIQTIDGILQNISETKWYTIQTISGVLQNTTSFKTLQTISGVLQNTTSFKTIQTITGVLQNATSFKTIQTISGVLQNITSFKTLQTISGVLQNTTSFKTHQTISGTLQNITSFKTIQTISGVLQNISAGFSTNLTVTGLSPTYNTTWSKNTTGMGSSNMRTFINNSSFPPINRNETMALHIAVNDTSWVKNITFWSIFLQDVVNGSIIDCDNITLLVSLDNTTWDILQHNAGSGMGRFPKDNGYLIWNQSTSPAGINPFTYTHGAWYINANTTVYVRMMINITPTAHTGVYDNASGSDWQIQLHNNTLANPWVVWHYTTRLKLFNFTATATEWYTIQTISGTLRNDTSFKTLQTITGVLQNTTSFKTLQTINGTLQNISDEEWTTIQTISGVLRNDTSFKTLQTISGILQNTTSFKTLQTISGVLQNITSFRTLQTISSGVLQNITSFKTLQTISGVLRNVTSFQTTQTITGVLRNITSFQTIQSINGTLRNGSWWTIQTINGTIQNTSLVNITINSYQPLDNATGVCPCDAMCVEINATDNVNMTVYRKSHDEVVYYLVANYTNISAGERCFPIEGHIDAGMLIPIFFNETYDWYAYIEYYNDTTINYTSPVYNFTTEDNPDLCGAGGGSFVNSNEGRIGIVGLCGILGLIFCFIWRKKRKNQ